MRISGKDWKRLSASWREKADDRKPTGPGKESHFLPHPLRSAVIPLCMKGKRIRYQQTGEFHFLTFSCYRRRSYLEPVAAVSPSRNHGGQVTSSLASGAGARQGASGLAWTSAIGA
jgi:hypothetical protein